MGMPLAWGISLTTTRVSTVVPLEERSADYQYHYYSFRGFNDIKHKNSCQSIHTSVWTEVMDQQTDVAIPIATLDI